MEFLDALRPAFRSVLEQHAQVLELTRGQYLIRRGEPGGDVFLLRSGGLEAVDGRATPEQILNTFGPGAMVGEMAFVDGSPRSVDVRAGSDSVVLRLRREELNEVLTRHPELAAAFYETVAKVAVQRVRFLTDGAAVGGFGARDLLTADADTVRMSADGPLRIAEKVKLLLPNLELQLHRSDDPAPYAAAIHKVLDTLEREVDVLFESLTDLTARNAAAAMLRRELHPYLLRSSLAERSIRRPDGEVAAAEVLAHVLVDAESGEGLLGTVVDRWLLDRPTFRALRSMRDTIISLAVPTLPRHRNRRVLVLPVGTGSLVASLAGLLGSPPTVLTVLDQRDEALALIRGDRHPGVEIRTLHESLTRFALGQSTLPVPPQDAILVHSILEYLPERMAVSLLRTVSRTLAPDGVAVISSLAPAPDHVFLDRLLAWPTLRRTEESFAALARAAGLRIDRSLSPEEPALVTLLSRDPR